jgi:hypothetical protein
VKVFFWEEEKGKDVRSCKRHGFNLRRWAA